MDLSTECADEQTWRQFVAGGLAAAERESLQTHAASCQSCAELVRHLSQSEARLPDVPPDVPSLTMTKAFLSTKDDHVPDVPEFDLDETGFDASLLTPAVRPDSLGRLGKYDVLGTLGHGAFGVVLRDLMSNCGARWRSNF